MSDIELNPLSLFQRTVAAALDLRVVDEDIRGGAVVGGGDKAEALFAVEPFHSSLCHTLLLLSSGADVSYTHWKVYCTNALSSH